MQFLCLTFQNIQNSYLPNKYLLRIHFLYPEILKIYIRLFLFEVSQNRIQYTVSLFGISEYTKQLYTEQISAESIFFVF